MNRIEFDEESYKSFKEEIEKLEARKRELLVELGSSEYKYSGMTWHMGESVKSVQRELEYITAKLKKLKSITPVLKETTTQNPNIVSVGNTYKTTITYSDGETVDKTFKLVTAFPKLDLVNDEIKSISISSPIGAAINGKAIGGNYNFVVAGETNKITVVEQVNQNSTGEQNEA